MKKLIYSLIIVIVMLLAKTTNLQAQSFDVGTNVVNLGVGFGSSIAYYANGGSSTPVITGSFEHGIAKLGPGTVGIGLAVGYQGASYSYNDGYGDTYKDSWSTTLFGVRGTYHPDFLNGDKYDVYGVLQISYDHFGYTHTESGPYIGTYGRNYGGYGINSSVYPYLLVGGRYYFTDNIGAFAELGYDLAYLKIGLSAKFGGGK